MVKSNEILSQHYKGDVVSSKTVKPEEILSNRLNEQDHGKPNVASYPYGVYRPDFVQIDNKVYAVTRTSDKKYLTLVQYFLKNGPITQDGDYGIEGWKSASEDNYSSRHNVIPKNPDFALIVSPRLGMYFPNKRDTPVSLKTSHDIVNAFDPNRLGFAYSKIANLEETLRSMSHGNEHYSEAAEWINFLAKKGFSIDKSPYGGIIGLGVEKGDFVAAYYPGGYLAREVNFHNKAKSMISRYGLTDREAVEAMKRSVLLHEFGHVVGIKNEELQGLLQAEFYSMMAERYKGTRLERVYRGLAKEGKDYAQEHSLANTILDIISGDASEDRAILNEYKTKFLAEAIVLGKEDIERYVNDRMEETFGALKGEPSYRTAKTKSKSEPKSKSEKSSNSRRGGLEKLIESLEKEADALGVDRTEYISDYLAKNSEYAKDNNIESKAEKESPQEAETAEAN